jgi:hypothetical protein
MYGVRCNYKFDPWAETVKDPIASAMMSFAHDPAAAIAQVLRLLEDAETKSARVRIQQCVTALKVMYSMRADWNSAVEYALRENQLEPPNASRMIALARFYERDGNLVSARDWYERAYALAKTSGDLTALEEATESMARLDR